MSKPIKLDRRQVLTTLGLGGLAGLTFTGNAVYAAEGEVVVLANARNPTKSLAKSQVRKIFLGQTAFWHGVVPVRVLIRPDRSKSAQAFYATMLDMTPQAYRKHWDQLQLAGRGVAPKSCGTLDEMQKLLGWAPGSIGFALASDAWKVDGVKQIKVA